jgi:hypothetical protein
MRIHDEERPKRYENFHISFGGTIAVFGFLAIAAVISHAALWDWWTRLSGPPQIDSTSSWAPANQTAGSGRAPLLQTNPPADWVSYKRRQTEELNSARWLGDSKRMARVPIEVAIQTILSNGLPQWSTNSRVSPIELQWQRSLSKGGSE